MTEIKISYSATPKGQIGPRPQKIALNESCRFTCADPGTLTIEFVNGSPVTNATKINKDENFVAAKSGHFKFKCILTPPGGSPITIGDPNDPNSAAGGEIEIGLS
jgi:hypothetical protein